MSSTQMPINRNLSEEIVRALKTLGGWGSVEIFVQDNKVTQITQRTIKKIDHSLAERS